eukprot:m.477659 g.477659  ORF g.477659 m.477659 type:complete len:191 (-) comp57163_c0_seq15:237-809(-)
MTPSSANRSSFSLPPVLSRQASTLASSARSRPSRESEEHQDGSSMVSHYDQQVDEVAAILFAVLSFIILIVGWQIHRSLQLIVVSTTRRQKLSAITKLICMYFVVFFLRFLWDVLNWKSVNYLQNRMYDLESNNNTNYFYLTSIFAFYLFFEVLPTLILLAIITKLISTRRPEEQPLLENFGVNSSQIHF